MTVKEDTWEKIINIYDDRWLERPGRDPNESKRRKALVTELKSYLIDYPVYYVTALLFLPMEVAVDIKKILKDKTISKDKKIAEIDNRINRGHTNKD